MDKIKANLAIGGKTNIIASALMKANKDWGDLFERETLKAGSTLIHTGGRPTHAYFPVDGMVSVLVSHTEDEKHEVQTLMGGSGDLVGVPALLSDAVSGYRVVVDLDTPAWRVNAKAARRLLDVDPDSQLVVNKYADLALTESWRQLARVAALPVRERLMIWLLHASHVAGDKTLPFGQPHIADRMGVRRPTVTDILKDEFEPQGLVSRSRGRVNILKPDELNSQSGRIWETMLRHRQVFENELLRA